MHIQVDKSSPLSIKDQIKSQIRALVTTGTLSAGEALPAAQSMAAMVGVNRNTVATAYREMAAEGLLMTVKGSGTFVKEGIKPVPTDALQPVLDEAFSRARAMGYTLEQFTDLFLSRLAVHGAYKGRKILAVWCNRFTIDEVCRALEGELQVSTRGVLLQELEKDPRPYAAHFKEADLVVTSIFYVKAVTAWAKPHGVEVFGIMITPVTRILNRIAQLPRGTTVGLSCVNDKAAEATCQIVRLSGDVTLNTIWAGADDTQKLQAMLDRCDVIFATHLVYDRVCQLAGPCKEVIHVDATINSINIELIRERLSRLGFTNQ